MVSGYNIALLIIEWGAVHTWLYPAGLYEPVPAYHRIKVPEIKPLEDFELKAELVTSREMVRVKLTSFKLL